MIEVRTVAEVDQAAVDELLGRHFRPAKAAFLREHGTWWHRGDENRWVLLEGGEVLGYCAVIPTRIAVGGEPVDASWWVDLVIDPAARGRKLQRHFDDLIRSRPLTLGFPNALAAAIHRRHGWGVREDLQVRLLVLDASQFLAARSMPRWQHLLLGPPLVLGAFCFGGGGAVVGDYSVDPLDEGHLADLARLAAESRAARPLEVATWHDASTLRWRYLEAPWSSEHFVVRSRQAAAILRIVEGSGRVARILECWFGDGTEDSSLYAACVGAARSLGAHQLTVLAPVVARGRAAGRAGLLLRARGRFCWYTTNSSLATSIDQATHLWTLGDSDHDEP